MDSIQRALFHAGLISRAEMYEAMKQARKGSHRRVSQRVKGSRKKGKGVPKPAEKRLK